MYTDYYDSEDAFLSYSQVPLNRRGAATYCFSFWYFMSGYMGTLRVYISDTQIIGNDTRHPVWLRDGNFGTQWQQGGIDIPLEVFPIQEVKSKQNLLDINQINYL